MHKYGGKMKSHSIICSSSDNFMTSAQDSIPGDSDTETHAEMGPFR